MAENISTTGHEGEAIDVQGLKASLQKLKTDIIDKKATSSSLGTAATKNVPSSGNAGTTEVVMGNDSRLTDTRDPKSHTHTKSQITDFPSSLPANGGNADTVDGYHIAVVTAMPSTPDANTIYIVK